jgi:hypothetical protein
MALQISEIEQRLQSLIEIHLVKYLPGPAFQDRIAQRLAEALRANLSTQGLETPATCRTNSHCSCILPR